MEDDPEVVTFTQANQSLNVTENFSVYLMYLSNLPGSVWIAISQMNWSWSVNATRTNLPRNVAQPAPMESYPLGETAFPMWVDTTPNFVAKGPQAQ